MPNNHILPYTLLADRKVRGTTAIKGMQAYAIRDRLTGLYFVWSYLDREFAEEVAKRVTPESNADMAANWRKELHDLTPTARNSFR